MGEGTYGSVLKKAYVEIDGNDVSSLVREIHAPETYAKIDATGMNTEGATYSETGLYSATITITAKSTFGASSLFEIIRPRFKNQDDFEIKYNVYPLPTSEDNPQSQATVRLFSYAKIDAALNALLTTGLQLEVQGEIDEVYT